MAKVSLLDLEIDDIGTADLEDAIVECVKRGRKETFAYANVHAANIAHRDPRFRSVLREADFLYCDGEGIRLGAKILGKKPPQRTVLTRWVWDLGARLQEEGISVYLLGGEVHTVGAAAARWSARFPRLRLLGYHHGYFKRSGPENAAVLGEINRLCPNVLSVGFGMPEQELWIADNARHLQVNAIMPCGGMIDYLSGTVRVAPVWMSRHGMEWLHRFSQDPFRLWRRYLVGNPTFFFRIFRQLLKGGRGQ
jgi:N-acetylglucosaminyldiphosphoundecaprenol N-acetyl-beta-D-mannosaminyltransferase